MDGETKIILANMAEDIRELRDSTLKVSELIQETAMLRQQLLSMQEKYEEKLKASNQRHDDGRKVIHKRMDVWLQVAFWLGGTVVLAMGTVIMILAEKVLG